MSIVWRFKKRSAKLPKSSIKEKSKKKTKTKKQKTKKQKTTKETSFFIHYILRKLNKTFKKMHALFTQQQTITYTTKL